MKKIEGLMLKKFLFLKIIIYVEKFFINRFPIPHVMTLAEPRAASSDDRLIELVLEEEGRLYVKGTEEDKVYVRAVLVLEGMKCINVTVVGEYAPNPSDVFLKRVRRLCPEGAEGFRREVQKHDRFTYDVVVQYYGIIEMAPQTQNI